LREHANPVRRHGRLLRVGYKRKYRNSTTEDFEKFPPPHAASLIEAKKA